VVDLPGFLTPHTVTVEAYAGDGAYGPTYGAAVTSRAYVEDKRHLARDAMGNEVTAATLVWLPLDAGEVPPQSRMTVNGKARTVITTSRFDFGGSTPNHLEVGLL
jgi:hypothetical protein